MCGMQPLMCLAPVSFTEQCFYSSILYILPQRVAKLEGRGQQDKVPSEAKVLSQCRMFTVSATHMSIACTYKTIHHINNIIRCMHFISILLNCSQWGTLLNRMPQLGIHPLPLPACHHLRLQKLRYVSKVCCTYVVLCSYQVCDHVTMIPSSFHSSHLYQGCFGIHPRVHTYSTTITLTTYMHQVYFNTVTIIVAQRSLC